jgi:hypothetical protein
MGSAGNRVIQESYRNTEEEEARNLKTCKHLRWKPEEFLGNLRG